MKDTPEILDARYETLLAAMRVVHRRIEQEPGKSKSEIYDEVALDFGSNATTLRQRYGLWKKGGDEAVHFGRRGRHKGDGKLLSDGEEARIRHLLETRTPEQCGIARALWDREAVHDLIAQETGVRYSIEAIGKILHRWAMTVQKPVIYHPGRKRADVQAWIDRAYPALLEKARREDAEIWWADETGVQNDPNEVRGYAPRGRTPELRGPRRRVHLHLVSAVSNQGLVRFCIYPQAINLRSFRDFLERVIAEARGRKILLVVDNLAVHHARDLEPWLAENRHLLELFFLPSYSPDLNPDEFLNRDLKSALRNAAVTANPDEVERRVKSYLSDLTEMPGRIRSFFSYASVRYAA